MRSRKTADRNTGSTDGTMSLSGHLRELRNRILVWGGVFVALFCLALSRAQNIIDVLLDLGEVNGYHFVQIAPQELLIELFSVSMIFAFVVSLPLLLYQIYAFASPALKKNEKSLFVMIMIFGLLLAALGMLFAYRILLPFMLKFLQDVSIGTTVESSISVQSYISFLMTVFLIFAVIFEMPLVCVLLVHFGILKVEWMIKARKFVIVAIFFVAAVITPPDVASQIMVAVPMLALYQISIWLCQVADKNKKRREKAMQEAAEAAEEQAAAGQQAAG